MSTTTNQPTIPQPIIPAVVAAPVDTTPIVQLPDLPMYAEATPIVEAPKPVRKVPRLNCGKYAIGLLVVVVVIAVLLIVLFSGIPKSPVTPRNVVSRPVVSQVVSLPVEKPITKPKITDIAYTGIGTDGTIRVYDPQSKDLVINLKDNNWSNIQLAPQADFISVLSASAKDANDKNLNIYNVNTGEWKEQTVFDKATTGIDNYFWIDDSTIVFTQAGWLHSYDNLSGEIVKLVKLDQTISGINRRNKQLLFKSTAARVVKPATTKQIPQPDFRPVERAPLITVEDKPAIMKYDNVFTVTDYTGKLVYDVRVDDIIDLSGNYILNNLFFSPISGVYLAELVGYDPSSGAATREMLKLFMLSGELKQEIKIPSADKISILGLFQEQSFLFGVFDNNFALTSIGNIDFDQNIIANNMYPSPTSSTQRIDSIDILSGYNDSDWMLRVAATEQIKGLPVKQLGWWKLNKGLLQLEKVRIGVDFVELINYSKTQNRR